MEKIELDVTENMECPCPCEKCGKWFDLQDGSGSEKWFPNMIICESCGEKEREEIERDEQIESYQEMINEAEGNINYAQEKLIELDVKDFGKSIVFDGEQIKRLKKAIGNRKGKSIQEIVIDLCEKGDVY